MRISLWLLFNNNGAKPSFNCRRFWAAMKQSDSITSDKSPARVEVSLTASNSLIPIFIRALLGNIKDLEELYRFGPYVGKS